MKTSTLLYSVATLALASANVTAVKNAPLDARDASSLEARNFCTDTTCNSAVDLPEALAMEMRLIFLTLVPSARTWFLRGWVLFQCLWCMYPVMIS